MDNLANNMIKHLNEEVYCRLKPSPIHGIGVFAIKDIPIGTNPFRFCGGVCGVYNCIKLSHDAIVNLSDGSVRKIIYDFISPDEDKCYYVPALGPNSFDITFYLNHDSNPNIDIVSDGCEFMGFRTNRLVKNDEELTINYDHYKVEFMNIVTK
jgi:SET domain-containing protein